jgi:hypothetical protein
MFPRRTQLSHQGWLSLGATLFLSVALAACGGGGGGTAPALRGPAVTLSIQPTTIAVGQTGTLMWSTTGASTCSASGAWSGSEATTGTQMVTPTTAGSNTYTLTCTAPSGSGYGGGGSGSTAMSVILTINAVVVTAYVSTSLVADTAGGTATSTDAHLVNPWGIVFGPGAPVWVANNHSETSTLYDGSGKAQPAGGPATFGL